MPNFMSQSRKINDPIYRDRGDDLMSMFYHQVPGLTGKNLPKVGMFGELIAYPDPKGSIMALKRTSNTGRYNDAMYVELKKIGVDSLPEYNFSWSEGFTDEQKFIAKTIGGEMFRDLLEAVMLNSEDGTVKESWTGLPHNGKLAVVAFIRNASNKKVQSEFMDNYKFDKTQQVADLKYLLKNVLKIKLKKGEDVMDYFDDDIMREANKAIYSAFNNEEERLLENNARAKLIKEKKEKAFYKDQQNKIDIINGINFYGEPQE